MKKNIHIIRILLLTVFCLFAFSSCGTVGGLGSDIQNMGKWMQGKKDSKKK